MEKSIVMSEPLQNRINPQLFSLWVAMASMIMLFGAFTSAYIVKQAAGNWLEFTIPIYFYISTAVILASSFTISKSYKSYINQEEGSQKLFLWITLALGLTFVVLQYLGWSELYEIGVDFRQNVSGSFFYLITGAHAAHVIGGIAAIVVALIHTHSLPYEYKDFRKNRFQLVVHYWHFVDALWIYLLIFLLYIK